MTGTIFNIQKFCVNDGPGIRTTVFFKGCPLRCIWCHNPESKSAKPELFYNAKKCVKCGKCASVCDFNVHSFIDGEHIFKRELCASCGKCEKVCPASALEMSGYEISTEDVIAAVLRDKIFYDNSGGGMTLSGGEPMLQYEFALELMKKAKENGLHTCMETCGYAPWENYQKISEYTDIFLFDYKVTNPEKHKEYTGVTNEKILENLKMLDSIGKSTILRCPIIPTLNDDTEHLLAIAKTANLLKNVIEINIEPYHPLGKGKSELLGKDYLLSELDFPSQEEIEKWIETVKSKTDVPVLRG